MSPEVTIAVITAFASLLVAIVSLVNSIISNRQSARSATMIETLKHELADRESTRKMSDEYLVKGLESLDILIQTIQRLKDMIQLIVTSGGTSLDSESAMLSITEIREALFNCYEEQLPNLQEQEAKGAHRAKNQAWAVETHLRDCLEGTEYVSEMSDEQRQTLVEFRNNLTDAQNQLRDSRANKLTERIKTL